jgi:uncharacterized protein with NRDE domain
LANAADTPEDLLDLLTDEELADRDAHPIFIRSPVYGTRCSTVVAVDIQGQGQIIERGFDAEGKLTSETRVSFIWS